MSLVSRRDAGKLLLAGCAGALAPARELWGVTKIDSVVRGVQIGAQAWSFRDRPIDACIAAYREVGLGECELSQVHFGGPPPGDPSLDPARLDLPLSNFQELRRKFDNAGVSLSAYGNSFHTDITDPVLERSFQITQAMGLDCITTSTKISMVPRIDKFAQKYKIKVGYHNHDHSSDPDEFATAEGFERALKGASSYARINLDIGHFTAANQDAVAFIRKHHAKIVTLHIKDRKKDHGPNVPLGLGDTPIVEVLRLVRDNHWKFPANIEYEYGGYAPGLDTITEVKKCYAYCRKALES
jgi:sugar phosphate isomerase/epimerase